MTKRERRAAASECTIRHWARADLHWLFHGNLGLSRRHRRSIFLLSPSRIYQHGATLTVNPYRWARSIMSWTRRSSSSRAEHSGASSMLLQDRQARRSETPNNAAPSRYTCVAAEAGASMYDARQRMWRRCRFSADYGSGGLGRDRSELSREHVAILRRVNLKPLLALSGQGPRLWGRNRIMGAKKGEPVIITPPIEDYSRHLQAAAAAEFAIPDPLPRDTVNVMALHWNAGHRLWRSAAAYTTVKDENKHDFYPTLII